MAYKDMTLANKVGELDEMVDFSSNSNIANAHAQQLKLAPIKNPFVFPVDFPEAKVFALLASQFGPPNGPLTACLGPGEASDAPFKWDYHFVIHGVSMHVIRSVSRLELHCRGGEVTDVEIINFFKYNIEVHKSKILSTLGQMEGYSLIMNPYYRHKNILQAAQRKLEDISLVSPIAPSSPFVDKNLMSAYIAKLTEFHQQVDEQAMYAMLVVIESAFRAEAFLNMVHAICLKSEHRLTKKALNQVLNKRWKNKVKDMPNTCNFIIKKPNLDDSRLVSIGELFNRRNRMAHSYPCPENMSVGEMYFAGDYPVLNRAVAYIDFAYTLNNQIPSVDDARSAPKAVEEFEGYLKELLDPSALAAVELFAKSQPVGYNHKHEIFSIPFGNFFIPTIALGAK